MKKTKFVIHDHDAKRAGHHWDLRLAYDDVLKSWAIPKARCPEKSTDKVLAIRVPDHAMDYYDFEGNITDEYGRGKVDIYDKGECTIITWKKDKINFILKGKKIKGKFWLIKLANKGASWLWLRSK